MPIKIEQMIMFTSITKQFFDLILCPFTFIAALYFKHLRKNYFKHFPLSRKILLKVGVFPIRDHYYEPMFNPAYLRYSLTKDRNIPGIDFNDTEQLSILERFNYNHELLQFPNEKQKDRLEYCYNVGSFRSGDGEYLYNMIRLFKPSRIIEIGCGFSTLMAVNAIKKNQQEDIKYQCEQICIEPFECDWLKDLNINLIRRKVEEININFFNQLNENDILFIDSSHIIRPQGDVLFEIFEILPSLRKGVLIHFHDIFTPKDYPLQWLGHFFGNEQYLLEAFLAYNQQFRIIGSTNYLLHHHHDFYVAKCPNYKKQEGNEHESLLWKEPASFWLIKN